MYYVDDDVRFEVIAQHVHYQPSYLHERYTMQLAKQLYPIILQSQSVSTTDHYTHPKFSNQTVSVTATRLWNDLPLNSALLFSPTIIENQPP